MSIIAVDPPVRKSARGRDPRLSDADVASALELIKSGKHASDGETVAKQSTAAGRAQSLRTRLLKDYKIATVTNVQSVIVKVNGKDTEQFTWSVGPKPVVEKIKKESK